jgi:hypothetical protein
VFEEDESLYNDEKPISVPLKMDHHRFLAYKENLRNYRENSPPDDY